MLNAKEAAKLTAEYKPINYNKIAVEKALEEIESDAKAGKNKTVIHFFDSCWYHHTKHIKGVHKALESLGYEVTHSWLLDTLKVSWAHFTRANGRTDAEILERWVPK